MLRRRENIDNAEERQSVLAFAALLAVLTAAVFLLLSSEVRHWFVIPVTICGAIVLLDALDWVRGARDLFDPVGILGLLGVHFFFLAPLLHVVWDQWMWYVQPPPDWREWLGYVGTLNAFGLLFYRGVVAYIERTPRRAAQLREVDHSWFWPVAVSALVISALSQVAVFARFGGISGYVQAYEQGRQGFEGLGLVLLVSESFPIVAIMCAVVWLARGQRTVSWATVAMVLLAFICLRFFFAGLRGSRSAMIWSLFWAVGLVHIFLRPIPRKLIPIGLVGVTAFMYVYGFYKAGGVKGLEKFVEGGAARQEYAEKSGRTMEVALLSDFGRADVQAFLLYRLTEYPRSYDLALGRTYLGTAFLLTPRQIMPDRPPLKDKFGTELMYGRGSYRPGKWVSSSVYGLAGETMLNFGPWLVPFAFGVLGLAVGYVSLMSRSLQPGDARWLLYPFFANFAFTVLIADSDNVLVFLFQNGMIPAAVVWLGSRLVRREARLAVVTSGAPGALGALGVPGVRRRRWSDAVLARPSAERPPARGRNSWPAGREAADP
jgi:hypothetical protein